MNVIDPCKPIWSGTIRRWVFVGIGATVLGESVSLGCWALRSVLLKLRSV